jgi:hypothetical protein
MDGVGAVLSQQGHHQSIALIVNSEVEYRGMLIEDSCKVTADDIGHEIESAD